MLNLWRRHLAKCKHSTRKHNKCSCPIWVQGTLHGEWMKKSLGIRNWESAQKIVRDWEARIEGGNLSVAEAFAQFISDGEARHLKLETLGKYRLLEREMTARFGPRPVDAISLSDLSEYRQSWKLAGISSRKKFERLRTFFRFCMERGWTEKNPATLLKPPRFTFSPTLPVEEADFQKLVAACEKFPRKGIYGPKTGQRIKAFLLTLRYSGLRIRDCVMLTRKKIQGDKLFLYSQKTNVPVWLPLPKFVLEAIEGCGNGEYYFWSGIGNPKSCVADWQRSLARLGKLAGVKFHAHQLRDSFAIGLLTNGVSLETVSVLLGNSLKICERHYNPWVKSRQDNLAREVERAWSLTSRTG